MHFLKFLPMIEQIYCIYNKSMQSKRQWQTCRQDLRLLLAEKSMPPKMEIKLKYLEAAISGNSITYQLFNQLPQFQKLSLKQMPVQTMITLFNGIVRCLTGKQVIVLFNAQKAWVRKEEYFSSWQLYELTCDNNTLSIFKIKDKKSLWKQFRVQKLSVSKLYKQQKKKYVFGIIFERRKYQIGLEDERACSRVHASLIGLIREKRALKNKVMNEDNIQSNQKLKQNSQNLQFERQEGIFDGEFNEEQYFEDEERQYLSNLQFKIEQLEVSQDAAYELLKNIHQGKIMQNTSIRTLKVCMVIQNCQIQNLIEAYIQFNAWNLQVDTFKVINRIRNNTFLAYLKLKKYGMFSYQRQAYITISYFKSCECLSSKQSTVQTLTQKRESSKISQNNKHYLIINTAPDNFASQQSSGAVRMDFNQVVQFRTVEENNTAVFMVVLSKIDYKGYEYLSNNRQINLNFINDICSLPKYCQQKALSGSSLKIFVFNYCICKNPKKRKNSAFSDIQINNQRKNSNFMVQVSQINKLQQQRPKDLSEDELIKAIQDTLNDLRNDNIIKIIKQKKYQKYYLKHPWTQETHTRKFIQSKYTEGIIKDFLLQAGRWKLDNNQLIFCDQEALKTQKGIIKMVLKQVAASLAKGKSIMNMSLPVEMFDKKSMLQTVANLMGFFPVFMIEAVNASNLVEQIKYITMAFMFLSACRPNIQKPFNPILGETLQGFLGGIPVYFQQIFHHPPTSSFYVKTQQFESYGNFDTHVDMGLNSVTSKVSSFFTVKIYKTKTEYVIKLPYLQMGGLMFGDRTIKIAGRSFVYEKKNDLYCQFSAGKDKKSLYQYKYKIKSTDIAGGVFKVTNSFGKKLLSLDKSKPFEGLKSDDVIQKYSQISGKWFGDIYFDEVPYKTVQKGPFPVKLQRPVYLLPSDCLFREDIVYKAWGLIDKSNQEKQILQNIQRKDRKLRQKGVLLK